MVAFKYVSNGETRRKVCSCLHSFLCLREKLFDYYEIKSIQHEKNVEDYTLSEEMLNFHERNVKDLYSYFVGIKMKYKEIGVGNNSVMCGYCKREYEVVEEFYDVERFVKDLQEKYVKIDSS